METLNKSTVNKITISLSLVILILFSTISKATPPDYLSEYCFLIEFNPPFENSDSVSMRMGVTYSGDRYYLGQGIIEYPITPLIFTGTIIPTGSGDRYQMSASGTEHNILQPGPGFLTERMVIQNIHMVVDSATLNGTVRIKETVIDNGVTQPDSPDSYTSGKVTFKQSCSL